MCVYNNNNNNPNLGMTMVNEERYAYLDVYLFHFPIGQL